MERFRILSIVLAFAAIAIVCVPVEAQADQDVSTPTPTHVRKASQRPMPFPPGSETVGAAAAIEYRSIDRMTRQDRDLVADAESSIGERARFDGLEFNQASNQGKWSYEQVVCSALPKHLFLRFTRNDGAGDVSVFSASIPRGGDGRVRIIPILRRGYSLFSPAPINALTISAFNHIRAEENPDKAPGWLATGLCYAALAGAHPETGPAEVSEIRKLPAAPTGMLEIPVNGGAVISFTDVAAMPRPMEWTMTFDGKGKLVKATHSAVPKSMGRAVSLTPVEVKQESVLEPPAGRKVTRSEATQRKGKVILRRPKEVQGKTVQPTDPNAKAILIK